MILNPNDFVKNEDDKKTLEQLEQFKLTFDIGPIVVNSNPNTINSAIGISFSCLYCTDHRYFLKYNYFYQTQEPRRVDFGNNNDLISSSFHEIIGHSEWVRVFENISIYSRIYGNRVKTSDQLNGLDILSPEYLVRITPFALRFHVLNKLENIDASVGFSRVIHLKNFSLIPMVH